MMANPKHMERVQIWYRSTNRHLPYHGAHAVVIVSSKGKPRNHLVWTGADLVVVPCGNLRRPK